MKSILVSVWLGGLTALGCGNSENAGARAAEEEAKAEIAKRAQQPSTAKKLVTPVANGARIPCTTLIDPVAFTTALAEKDPLTVKDVTSSNSEAASSCSLIRGGTRLTAKQQEALLKKQRRLGVLAGDEVCNVTAYCWTVEEDERFRKRCTDAPPSGLGRQGDHSLGSYACLGINATGSDDVHTYRLLDEDTKCVLEVRGGPSMVDNAVIADCAKAARDHIGPANIKP